MTARTLTVHETGPDGSSTYQLVIGEDISVEDAEALIARSGGTEVYAMHRYENGKKVESFVSRSFYNQLREAIEDIPAARGVDEIRANINERLKAQSTRDDTTASSAAQSVRRWWEFWRD